MVFNNRGFMIGRGGKAFSVSKDVGVRELKSLGGFMWKCPGFRSRFRNKKKFFDPETCRGAF